MGNAATYNIQTAIEDSVREDRIVHLEARTDTQEWVDLVNGLAAKAEDWTETKDADSGNDVREYWGKDEDGDEWRIHVTCLP